MLIGKRLNLIPIGEHDLEWLRKVRNEYKDYFFDSGEISSNQQSIWYRKYQKSRMDHMYIVELKNREKIGTIAIYNIDLGNRTATIGRVLLLDIYRGQGYAEEFIHLLLEEAFKTMRLYKIRVECHIENIDAIAIYSRVGFKAIAKPIMLLEKINPNYNPKKPIKITSYDEMGEGGYESQCTNVLQ